MTNSRTSLPTTTFEPYRIDSECAVPYLGMRSTVLSRRPAGSASLSSTRIYVQGPKDIGERRRQGATTSRGGEPGRRASRRRFLHNTTCNSISANYELARSCP